MNDSLKRFQDHLRQVFQLDWADLDFGIYRILRYKRQQIEQFINTRLPQIVDEAFAEYSEAEREALQQQLARLKQEITTSGAALGQDPFDANGELREGFRQGKLGKQYLSVLASLESIHVTEELKNRVYNDLFSFFSRYYEDGDFISKRRYSQKETYAIPYNGEEVVLHWANKDQYYIKTDEWHKSYRFRVGDFHVAFALKNVAPDQKGNQDDKRYYVLSAEDALDWNLDTKTLTIFFEFRLLTGEEKERYGKTETQKPQLGLNEESTKTILEQVQEPALRLLLAKPDSRNGKENSVLGWRLNHFTIRNTTDFFIHKDLRGFLRRELEFFIKNEVLLLDELVAGDMASLDRHVRRARVVRKVADNIIDFLAQVEDFQKKLFEKKKFVVRTDYCLTIDRVPEDLWDEVLSNKAQIEEWRQLYSLDEIVEKDKGSGPLIHNGLDKDFLRRHSTLVIDTRLFSEDFKWRLLASIRDVDGMIDGMAIKSENYQALNMIMAKLMGRVKCIHIDPPYNTATTGFLYKNNYQHSSWLTMMENRIRVSLELLCGDGSYLCHIDENEYERLQLLFDKIGLPNSGTVVWDKRNPMLGKKGVATQHEYICWRSLVNEPIYLRNSSVRLILNTAKEIVLKHGSVTETVREEFSRWISSQPGLSGGERAYRYLDNDGRVYQSVAMGAPEPRTDPKFFIPIKHPVTKKPCPVPSNGWSRAPETIQQLLARDEIIFGQDETVQPRRKVFLTEESRRQIPSIIPDSSRGKVDVDDLGIEFPYCHPVSLYIELIAAAAPGERDLILDFFAGSGTTAHAVINLNREDGGRRKFILVEVADYFDTLLLPRLKKVTFAPEWASGKPKREPTAEEAERGPHLVKYIRLENYEDTLTNLELPREKEGQLAFAKFGDDYLLRYMLDFETQGSQSLLNLDAMKDPFSYKLKVQEDDEYVERPVDLVETFNYLLGLNVKRMQAFSHGNRPYRVVSGEKQGKRVVILWRPLIGLEDSEEALMKEKTFIEKTILPAILPDAKPDRLFANGPCAIEGAESIEPEFKRLMFAGVV